MISRRGLPWLALPALAQEAVSVLSGGALEPPLHAALALWQGALPDVTFNTSPIIAQRLLVGERPDVLLAPAALFQARRLAVAAVTAVPLGGVSVGVAVGDNAANPGITDEASFRTAVLAADALVFNRASSGLYMDQLFTRLGLTDTVAAKSVRLPDGDSVLRRIAGGNSREIGFAAITEILLFRGRGVRLMGPLPVGLGHSTLYAGAALTPRGQPLMTFLASEPARAAMQVAGLE